MESDNDLRNADDRVGADFELQHFWPGCNGQTSDWAGLNVLLIVLRHLGSFVPYESRSNEMTQRNEDKNPILKLVWQKIQGKTPLEGEMTLRRKVSEVFMQEGTKTPTFNDLLTHPLMKETLLSSPGYQLFRQQSWVLNPGPSRVWQPGRLFDDKEIAQTTPFLWDGKRPLDEVLHARFGPFRDTRAPNNGRLLLHMFAKPWFMFINYQKEDNKNRREFSSLQKLHFEASGFVLQDNGQGYTIARTKVAYTLVAVVFQSNGASNDFVRLYSLDGGYIHPSSRAQDIVTYDQWSVTPDIGSFMLVYARDTTGRPIEFSQETGPVNDTFDENNENDFAGAAPLGDPAFDFPFIYNTPQPKQINLLLRSVVEELWLLQLVVEDHQLPSVVVEDHQLPSVVVEDLQLLWLVTGHLQSRQLVVEQPQPPSLAEEHLHFLQLVEEQPQPPSLVVEHLKSLQDY
ncbi:hypothetical protein BJ166DRAFT_585187 [Pestalotiopsis sp. NC0098]|nr:hypothetical protein BJ166DRAFT_585187 [Pestalotiopsis sp. NC0098]